MPMTLIPRVLAALFLGACGAQPAPHMFGAERFEASRGGHDYVVFLKGSSVEVIRLGWASPGEHQGIRATMIDLIPDLTGCKLRESSLQGDSGEMRGLVTCPRSDPRSPPHPAPSA